MPKRKWSKASLGEVVELLTGFPFKSAEFSDDPTNPRLLRGDNVVQGAFRWDGAKFWPRDRVDGLASYALRAGDVIVAMDRPWIEAGLKRATVRDSDLPALLVQRVSRLRAADDDVLDQGFLRYIIDDPTFTDYILAVQTGTSVPHISGAQIKGYEFDLPPLPEQRAIARVLGGLDDKIELNRRMSRTLEDLARGLFRSWFVDFDPVTKNGSAKAPAAGLIGSAAPSGLFPKRLVDSPLGPIPEGWRVGTVGDLCDWIVSGGTPSRQKAEYWQDATIRWFKTGELTDGPLLEAEERISQRGLDDSACRLWQPGTVLFALYASPTLGRMGVLEEPGTSNQACAALWVKPEYGLGFLVQTLFLAREELQRISSGAAQQNINQGILRSHAVVIPTPNVAASFSRIVDPWYREQVSLARESRHLAALRDALLPQLLSGEVRLSSNSEIATGVA